MFRHVTYQYLASHVLSKEKENTEGHLRSAFAMYDTDKSGFISAQELKNVISDFGIGLGGDSKKDEAKFVEQIMGSVDSNKDGKISFDEFTSFMNSMAGQ